MQPTDLADRLKWLVVLLPVLGFGCSETDGDLLQSSCVHDELALDRTIEDGKACTNFGYGDCKKGASGSECINYCAHEICQSGPCTSDADCADFGEIYECQEYVVSSISYGMWCGESDCPKGTQGCPCLDGGKCYDAPFVEAECGADNICGGEATCQRACIVGSVCCGGALCSGDCIGTPCCS